MGSRSHLKFTRAMLVLLPFAKAFVQRGGDVETILARHRIPVGALTDPAMLVDAAACYAAMDDMATALDDPYFGAFVAVETANRGSPAIREAASQAVTFGDFLSRVVVEVAKQVDNVRYLLTVSSESASLEVQRTIKVSGSTVQLDAVGIAFFVTLVRRGLGTTFDANRIVVTAPSIEGLPPNFLPKRALIKSGINGLKLSYPPEWLWAPFALDWQFEDAPRGEFGGMSGEGMLVHFRNVVVENIDQEDLSLARFSEIVGLHPRRVQRLLASHDTSFRQLKDNVRRGIALDLLSNPDRTIAEIALQLGFFGPSAFDRAFKQWTGKTPTEFQADSLIDPEA